MSPLREVRPSWTERFPEEVQLDSFLKRFYMIFEGTHTEYKYFEGLDNNKRLIGIPNTIEIVILDKSGDVEGHSQPKKLLELANSKKVELQSIDKYDDEVDRFVIVFDRDSFKSTEEYFEFTKEARKENILGITNPCFEIWLLLHYSDSLDAHIWPNKSRILKNDKVSSRHTYTSKLFSDVARMNSKTSFSFEKLKDKIDVAIDQERSVAQNINDIENEIGSNIGILIETMRKDPRDILF